MNKTLAKIISILELIVAIIMYFAVAYQFDNDPVIMKILPHTDFEATLLRLSITTSTHYVIFCMTFNTKGILCFAGILEILAGHLTLYFKGKSDLMNVMGIVMIVFGILFILCVLTIRVPKKKKEKKKKEKQKRSR